MVTTRRALTALHSNTAPPPEHQAYLLAAAYQPIIDSLTAHIALLDEEGVIVAVNQAWRQFADLNDGHMPGYGLGTNYLSLLDGMESCTECGGKCTDDLRIARQVAAGLRQVLAGGAEAFRLEYPCDAPDHPRWFLLTITSFPRSGQLRAVVAHEDVTALKLAEEHSILQSRRLVEAFSGAVNAIALSVEKRDPYTAGHQNQVAHLCEIIATRLGWVKERITGLRLGAIIHDIGKISVPAEILSKPGRLNSPELQIIRIHPETGYDILKGINFPWPIADMVRQHHERLDGTGYPGGLRGDEICAEARVIAVADIFDAITSHRPYRPAKPRLEGIRALEAGRGSFFDDEVVGALLDHLDEEASQSTWGE